MKEYFKQLKVVNFLFKFYTDPCDQPKEAGPCAGNFTKWYFNRESQTCEQFIYGGCKANDNNFPTEIACHQQCLQPGRRKGTFPFHLLLLLFCMCIKTSCILNKLLVYLFSHL